MFYVYEHWRTDRDECFYVGKGKGKRAYNMYKRNPFHKAIQKKVAKEGHAIEVKIVASNLTEQEAFALEIERIKFWRDSGADLANFTLGGEGTAGFPAWNRKEVICLEDNKIFKSATEAGIYYNISALSICDACNGKNRNAHGLHFMFTSDPIKTIKQIESEHAKRRKRVGKNVNYNGIIDGKDSIGRSAAGPMKNARKVLCIDDNIEFPSASAAARYYNLAKSAVIEMCLGKNKRVSVGGLKFKYLEDA